MEPLKEVVAFQIAQAKLVADELANAKQILRRVTPKTIGNYLEAILGYLILIGSHAVSYQTENDKRLESFKQMATEIVEKLEHCKDKKIDDVVNLYKKQTEELKQSYDKLKLAESNVKSEKKEILGDVKNGYFEILSSATETMKNYIKEYESQKEEQSELIKLLKWFKASAQTTLSTTSAAALSPVKDSEDIRAEIKKLIGSFKQTLETLSSDVKNNTDALKDYIAVQDQINSSLKKIPQAIQIDQDLFAEKIAKKVNLDLTALLEVQVKAQNQIDDANLKITASKQKLEEQLESLNQVQDKLDKSFKSILNAAHESDKQLSYRRDNINVVIDALKQDSAAIRKLAEQSVKLVQDTNVTFAEEDAKLATLLQKITEKLSNVNQKTNELSKENKSNIQEIDLLKNDLVNYQNYIKDLTKAIKEHTDEHNNQKQLLETSNDLLKTSNKFYEQQFKKEREKYQQADKELYELHLQRAADIENKHQELQKIQQAVSNVVSTSESQLATIQQILNEKIQSVQNITTSIASNVTNLEQGVNLQNAIIQTLVQKSPQTQDITNLAYTLDQASKIYLQQVQQIQAEVQQKQQELQQQQQYLYTLQQQINQQEAQYQQKEQELAAALQQIEYKQQQSAYQNQQQLDMIKQEKQTNQDIHVAFVKEQNDLLIQNTDILNKLIQAQNSKLLTVQSELQKQHSLEKTAIITTSQIQDIVQRLQDKIQEVSQQEIQEVIKQVTEQIQAQLGLNSLQNTLATLQKNLGSLTSTYNTTYQQLTSLDTSLQANLAQYNALKTTSQKTVQEIQTYLEEAEKQFTAKQKQNIDQVARDVDANIQSITEKMNSTVERIKKKFDAVKITEETATSRINEATQKMEQLIQQINKAYEKNKRELKSDEKTDFKRQRTDQSSIDKQKQPDDVATVIYEKPIKKNIVQPVFVKPNQQIFYPPSQNYDEEGKINEQMSGQGPVQNNLSEQGIIDTNYDEIDYDREYQIEEQNLPKKKTSEISGVTLAVGAALILAVGCGLMYLKKRQERSRSVDSNVSQQSRESEISQRSRSNSFFSNNSV